MRKAIKRQRTIFNKLMRTMERQLGNLASDAKDLINAAIAKAVRIVAQSKDSQDTSVPAITALRLRLTNL
jgi:hypothetical protein